MPAGIIPFNTANALCTANQCLQQVIGSLGNDPVEQYSSCVSMFRSPTTVTVAVPGDIVYSTTTATVPYTDIVVTLSTTSSTDWATSTSYAEVVETVTEYTATSIATVTEVVTTPSSAPTKKRRNKKRCQPSPSGGSSPTAPTLTTPSATPSAAPNCANREEYSSACSCINAVSSTVTVTNTIPGAAETVTVNETSTIAATSSSVVTVIVSSTTVVPATTTATSTVTGIYKTTTTVTSTSTPAPAPTPSGPYMVISSGPAAGRYLIVSSTNPVYLQIDQANTGAIAPVRISIPEGGGQPRLVSNVNLKLFLQNNSSVRNALIFVTQGTAASAGHFAVTCTVASGVVSCSGRGWTRMLNCGGSLYMATPTYVNSACTDVTLSLSS